MTVYINTFTVTLAVIITAEFANITPRSQVYYAECDVRQKLERKLEKMDDDILRFKKIVQKVRLMLY